MSYEYMSIAFGHEDGTHISQQQFWEEHDEVVLNPKQKKRLLENLEIQAIKFLKQNWRFSHDQIQINGECAGFTFRDEVSGALYFAPLSKIDIRVFFLKMKKAYLLVYDIKEVMPSLQS